MALLRRKETQVMITNPTKTPQSLLIPFFLLGWRWVGRMWREETKTSTPNDMIYADNPSLRGTRKEGEEVVRLVEEGVGGGSANNYSLIT